MQQPGKRRQIASPESKIFQIFCRIIKFPKLHTNLCTTEDIETSSPLLSAAWPGVGPDTGGVGHHLGNKYIYFFRIFFYCLIFTWAM